MPRAAAWSTVVVVTQPASAWRRNSTGLAPSLSPSSTGGSPLVNSKAWSRELWTELEGTIDLQGLLDLDPNVPAGYEEIRIKMHIEADCSDEELEQLLAFAKNHSPVCNTVCRPVPVVVERVN